MRIHNVRVMLIVILMFQINSGGSFKCYQCRSDVNKRCDENLNKQYYKECEEEQVEVTTTSSALDDSSTESADGADPAATSPAPAALKTAPTLFCRKIMQYLYINGTKSLVIRECGRVKDEEGCRKISNKLLYLSICECYKDGCNRSKRVVSVRILLILSFTVAIFHAYQ